MEKIVFYEIEINVNELKYLRKKQIAYIKCMKQFVYRNEDNELVYFNDTPEFRKAHQKSCKESYKEFNK